MEQSRRVETVADVRERIKGLYRVAHDAEMAHATEDEIHRDVLTSISEGYAQDPKGMAKEALRSLAINFPRWSA